jgi:hypothetical protein
MPIKYDTYTSLLTLQNEVSVFLEKLYQAQYYQEIDNCLKYSGGFCKGR